MGYLRLPCNQGRGVGLRRPLPEREDDPDGRDDWPPLVAEAPLRRDAGSACAPPAGPPDALTLLLSFTGVFPYVVPYAPATTRFTARLINTPAAANVPKR